MVRRSVAPLLIPFATACASSPAPAVPAPTPAADADFAVVVERLSEPGGFFPSDNLVSNETSYLHVLHRMEQLGVSGGAYLGVGPDQNFSYIAQVRPEVAFIIDIRRDNLLHHLLFKALFENARNRLEYLCLLVGRPVPENLGSWNEANIEQIVAYIDQAPGDRAQFEATASRVRTAVQRYGVPVTDVELTTIFTIHEAFHGRGLDIRYSYSSRHPTYRQLLLESDLEGRRRNYLANEENFRFVKELERRNRVIPVVGDLGGPHALAAIGKEIAARGLRISAFYVSNVEQYLMRGSGFDQFAHTVSALPIDERSVLIRSYFGRVGGHPFGVPGHTSVQLLELMETFTETYRNGGYPSYIDLVTRNVLPPRE
jgi:hypothetical protein